MSDHFKHYALFAFAVALVAVLIFSASPGGKHFEKILGRTNLGPFSIALADGWTWQRDETDAAAGTFAGEGGMLSYEFGPTADPLPDETDPTYEALYQPIDGKEAKLIWPHPGNEGVIGVYFPDVYGQKLTIVGRVSIEDRTKVAGMFRSIEFKNAPTKN